MELRKEMRALSAEMGIEATWGEIASGKSPKSQPLGLFYIKGETNKQTKTIQDQGPGKEKQAIQTQVTIVFNNVKVEVTPARA